MSNYSCSVLTLYPPISGLSFARVNRTIAPKTGIKRKRKLSQKAGWISDPYLPATKRKIDTYCQHALNYTNTACKHLNVNEQLSFLVKPQLWYSRQKRDVQRIDANITERTSRCLQTSLGFWRLCMQFEMPTTDALSLFAALFCEVVMAGETRGMCV